MSDRSNRLARRLGDEPDEPESDESTETEDAEPTTTGEDPSDAEDADAGEEQSSSSTPSSKSSKPSKTAMPAQTNPDADSESVKDRPSVLMYLPAELRQEMDIRFDEINAATKRERGEGLEKNRHWYPLLVSLALEKADELSTEELLARLDETDY